MAEPYFDANGTDGTDIDAIEKVYPDGTRVPVIDSESVAMLDADWQQSQEAAAMLIRYDPAGITSMIENASSVGELIDAVKQLGDLVTVLTALVRTGG